MSSALSDALIKEGELEPAQVVALPAYRSDFELAKLLEERELVDSNTILRIRGKVLGIETVAINPYIIDPNVVQVVPESLARRTRVVALFRVGNDLTLAMEDPADILVIDSIRDATGCDVVPILAHSGDIDRAHDHYYGVDHLMQDLVEEAQKLEGSIEMVDSPRLSLEAMADDESPMVRIVNLIILKAIRRQASDIHIEPDEEGVRVRYRVDGKLEADKLLPFSMHAPMVSRIKIMADLDLAQKRIPQDGRISLDASGRRIDLRISTLPTVRGEKTVIRLLDTQRQLVPLNDLGMAPQSRKQWEEIIHEPNGMILVTGPTGSGKTTTLYSSLAAINTIDTNIVTVEDPVEYDLPLISQVQVNAKAGLSFAAALRSILRQDPDVVLVGEIRDADTASIAVRAALTGHLVLSTLHTNDACGAVTRLVDIGVEPYLVASALRGVLAQRLVRKLCEHCPTTAELDESRYPGGIVEVLQREGIEPRVGKGCRHCNNSGFRGRLAIQELLVVNGDVERAIVQNASAHELRALGRRQGMMELFDDGLAKLRAGLTTLDEMLVATRLDDSEQEVPQPVADAAEPVAKPAIEPAVDEPVMDTV